jgi:hypothetical protein
VPEFKMSFKFGVGERNANERVIGRREKQVMGIAPGKKERKKEEGTCATCSANENKLQKIILFSF